MASLAQDIEVTGGEEHTSALEEKTTSADGIYARLEAAMETPDPADCALEQELHPLLNATQNKEWANMMSKAEELDARKFIVDLKDDELETY